MSDWGVKVPIKGFETQVINAWFDVLPAHINNCNRDEIWNKELDSEKEIIQFFGFDNLYCYLVLYPALLHALGINEIPRYFFSNEFYLINEDKFSTSRGNAIWGNDFINKYGSDFVRYYLSLTSPEVTKTNFNFEELDMEYKNLENIIDGIKNIHPQLNESTRLFIHNYQTLFNNACELENFSIKSIALLLKDYISQLKSKELFTN